MQMPRLSRVFVALVALVLFQKITPGQGSAARGSTAKPAAPAEQPAATHVSGDVARGEYLANNVAMCVQCHSPRDQHGVILASQKFKGAPMPVRGPAWSDEWAFRAPAIAGLIGFTDEQIVMLLTEGHAGDRPAPMRPMPPFRMTRQDAEAVIAYLRTR